MISIATPWGASDKVSHIADGIQFVSTPSHGGFLVSRERWENMPPCLRTLNKYGGPGPNGSQWFEEDCEAYLVVVSFPSSFTGDQVREAHAMAAAIYPEAYALLLSPEGWCEEADGTRSPPIEQTNPGRCTRCGTDAPQRWRSPLTWEPGLVCFLCSMELEKAEERRQREIRR